MDELKKLLSLIPKPEQLNPVTQTGNFFLNIPNNVKKSVSQMSDNSKTSMEATKALIKKSKGEKLTPNEQAAVEQDRKNNMNLVMASINPSGASTKAGTEVAEQVEKKGLSFLSRQPKSVVRVTLDPSISGAGREKAVQETVDTLIPGKSATEKYTNLQPTMEDLGQQIQSTMQRSPKRAQLSDIMKNYDTNLQKEGIYRNAEAGGNTAQKRDAVQKKAQEYITDLYNGARGETSDVVPTNIPDYALYELKAQVNSDAKSIYKKIENGTTLTDRDRVVLAARQTLDDTLSQLHPEVKELTTKQSHLYDAADSLYKGREAEVKAAADQPGLLRRVLSNPLTGGALAATGLSQVGNGAQAVGGLVTGGSAFINNLIDSSKNKPPTENFEGQDSQNTADGKNYIKNENGVITHTGDRVSQGSKGVNRYSFDNDPYEGGQLVSQQEYTDQANTLDTQIANAQATGNPVALAQLQGQRKVLDNTWASQQGLREVWNNPNNGIGSTLTVASGAYNKVNDVDPGFWNAWSGDYDKLRTASNGKYAQMANYLEYLSNATGTDFSRFKSKEALLGAIDASVDATKAKWDQLQVQYSGSPQIQSQPAPLRQVLQTPQQAPAPRPSMPPGGFGGDGGLTGNSTLDRILSF